VRSAAWAAALARIENVYGDRNVFCLCVPIDAFNEEAPA
jgi:hypothetical protein